MDEPNEKRPGWPEELPPSWRDDHRGWIELAVVIVIVAAIVIAGLLLLRPQIANIFNNVNYSF